MTNTASATRSQPAAHNVVEFPTAAAITAGDKRDLDRCIRADRRLTSSEKIVAEAILDFMNSRTGATYPSDLALSDRTGLSVDAIKRARAKLKQTGWLDWTNRPGFTNDYRVLTGNIPAIEAEQAALDEARRNASQRPAGTGGTPCMDALGGSASLHGGVVHPCTTNPLKEPTKRTHTGEPAGSEHLGRPKSNNGRRSQPDDRQEAIRGLDVDRPVTKSTPPPVPKVDDAGFVALWRSYPKRQGANPRAPALAAYLRAIKRGADPAAILRGVERLTIEQRRDIGTPYIPQAVTWLNQERWKDYGDATEAPITTDMTPEQVKEAKRLRAIVENAGFFR